MRTIVIAWAGGVALLVALMTAVAYAQTPPLDQLDPSLLGRDILYAVGILGGFIAWFRSTTWGQRIDGPLGVPLFALAVGATAGLILQAIQWLEVLPFALWAFPWGGLAYGVFVAIDAVFLVSLTTYIASKFGKAGAPVIVNTSDQGTLSVISGQQLTSTTDMRGTTVTMNSKSVSSSVVDYILNLVRAKFGDKVPPIVWGIVGELLKTYADKVLTDDLRSAIQAKFLDMLRAAGLEGQDL